MILTKAREAKIAAKAWEMSNALTAMTWKGRPKRVFVIVTGLFRNDVKLMGPDIRFPGLDRLINPKLTEHEYSRLIHNRPFPMESPGKYE